MKHFALPVRRHHVFLVVIASLALIAGLVLILGKPATESSHRIKEVEAAKKAPPSVAPTHPSVIPPVFTPDYHLPPVEGGLAPVIYQLPTKEDVVFLGIDDGAFKDPSVVALMKQNNIKASLFLSRAFIANDPGFFTQLTEQGSIVEDHTLSHNTRMIWTEGYQQQKNEICGMADYIEQHYGKRPTLFRPPGGSYSVTLRKAAADCGMKAVVTWIAKANGGSMQYQVGNKLRAGDIVLMHFRPEFEKDMQAFIAAEKAAGLHTALLEEALP